MKEIRDTRRHRSHAGTRSEDGEGERRSGTLEICQVAEDDWSHEPDSGQSSPFAAAIPVERMERMLRIREAIAAGNYSVTAAALVEKLPASLRSHLLS